MHRFYRRDLVLYRAPQPPAQRNGGSVIFFGKLTIKSQEAIAAAQDAARRRGNPELTPDHLLLALLDQDLFADWQGLRAETERKVAALPSVQGGVQLCRRRFRASSIVPTRRARS